MRRTLTVAVRIVPAARAIGSSPCADTPALSQRPPAALLGAKAAAGEKTRMIQDLSSLA